MYLSCILVVLDFRRGVKVFGDRGLFLKKIIQLSVVFLQFNFPNVPGFLISPGALTAPRILWFLKKSLLSLPLKKPWLFPEIPTVGRQYLLRLHRILLTQDRITDNNCPWNWLNFIKQSMWERQREPSCT